VKTPEDIIRSGFTGFDTELDYSSDAAREVMRELDAAGYAIVPKEPTEKMLEVGLDAYDKWQATEDYHMTEGIKAAYQAMLSDG
jgi:hypothetical protein